MTEAIETGAAAWVLFKPYDIDGPIRVYLDKVRAEHDFALVDLPSSSTTYELKEVPIFGPLPHEEFVRRRLVPAAPLDPDLQESLGHHGKKARDLR